MSVLATDNFNRGDSGDLGANWNVLTDESAWSIVSNRAEPTVKASDSTEYYNAISWPNDQYSQAKLNRVGTGSLGVGGGLALRCSVSARTCYRAVFSGAGGNDCRIGKLIDGAFTSLIDIDTDVVAGDIIYFEVQGTTLLVKVNGVTKGSVTDASIASGKVGIAYSSTASQEPQLDDWEGGDFDGAAATRQYYHRLMQMNQ